MEHDWNAGRFHHSAPGLYDCYDQHAECRNCGQKAILPNQSTFWPVKPHRREEFNRVFGATMRRVGDDADKAKELLSDMLVEPCGNATVDQVHRR